MPRPKRNYAIKRVPLEIPQKLYDEMCEQLKDDTGVVPRGAILHHIIGLIRNSLHKKVNLGDI